MSAIFILDQKGNPIIQRSYKGDVDLSVSKEFVKYLESDDYLKPPVFSKNGVSFLYITHSNLYLLIATKDDDNAMMLISFLYEIVKVLEDYFNKFTEEVLRKNFVLVYELLDEMIDFGCPQTTQATVLKDYICINKKFKFKPVKPPSTVTNAVSWRSEGIKHSKNEIFLDVVESLNLMINQKGKVIQSEINGVIKMKSFLSGMPELKLGLNDRLVVPKKSMFTNTNNRGIELEDIKFHQCVRLSRFESERTISFIPPDGEFDLMTYRLTTHIRPLFSVQVSTEYHKLSRIKYRVLVKSEFKRVSFANNVRIIVPVPNFADSPSFEKLHGETSYVPSKNSFVWFISQFNGSSEYELKAEFGLPKIQSEETENDGETLHVKVQFEIPYYTVSGIQVRYLKIIEKSGYTALPWVRYATKSGNYLVRMDRFEK